MDCAVAREAVSALLDGEDPGSDTGEVDRHLADCTECRAWREAAHDATRRVRLSAAQPVPRRTREVAAAVRASQRRRRIRPVPLYRAGLLAAAAGQLAISIPFLLFGEDRGAPVHVAHELGCFDAALAAGFLVVAWRPARALGMRALAGAAALLLVLTAVIDLAGGRTTVWDELPHLVAVAGWLMIRGLAASTPPATTQSRPGLLAVIGSRLPGRAGGGTISEAPAAPDEPAAAWARAGRGGLAAAAGCGSLDSGAVCGCVTGQCGCPGCAEPRRLAGG